MPDQPKKEKPKEKLDGNIYFAELTLEPYPSFFDIISESIGESFDELGKPVKRSVYIHLERTYGIKEQEIPFRIKDFQAAIEEMFGLGARSLELLFIKKIHRKIKLKFEWTPSSDLTFEGYLNKLKTEFEKYKSKKGSEK